MSALTRIVSELERARGERVLLPRVSGSARAFLAAELIDKGRLPVLIARNQEDAEQLFSDLAFMLGTTEERAAEDGLLFFGADEQSPYEEYSPDGRAVMERINTLYRLAKQRSQ